MTLLSHFTWRLRQGMSGQNVDEVCCQTDNLGQQRIKDLLWH